LKKSLIIIASALLVAVGAASHNRLRYDSSVFADAAPVGGPRTTQVEYPPCIKGVREDRCIQLYERGVRRNYQRWLAANGRSERVAARGPVTYRTCRGRSDDRCQQRAVGRQARNAKPTRAQQAQRRAAVRRAAARRATAVRRAPQRVAVARQTRPVVRNRTATVQRQRTPAQPPRPNPGGGGTPGI